MPNPWQEGYRAAMANICDAAPLPNNPYSPATGNFVLWEIGKADAFEDEYYSPEIG